MGWSDAAPARWASARIAIEVFDLRRGIVHARSAHAAVRRRDMSPVDMRSEGDAVTVRAMAKSRPARADAASTPRYAKARRANRVAGRQAGGKNREQPSRENGHPLQYVTLSSLFRKQHNDLRLPDDPEREVRHGAQVAQGRLPFPMLHVQRKAESRCLG